MKKVYVDTNILVDLLIDRPPFTKLAIEIFNKADKNSVKLFTSSHSLATTHYILKKHISEIALRELLFSLLKYIDVVPIDISIIMKSLLSTHKDFEDAIQIFAANTIDQLDFIVTRNLKDFKGATIRVLPPDELLEYL